MDGEGGFEREPVGLPFSLNSQYLEIHGKPGSLVAGRLGGTICRNAVEFQPVTDQLVAQVTGDPYLEPLDLLVDELDDFARLQIDQVMMVLLAFFSNRERPSPKSSRSMTFASSNRRTVR